MYRSGRNYENINKAVFDGADPYGIPKLLGCDCESDKWIGFNFAKSCNSPENYGIHFFIDDYQFLRLWTNPAAYLPMLLRFQAVCAPDFSTYTDFPLAVQIYNHYRKHWLGAYWEQNGVKVIPTISWSDEGSFAWCFDGEPVGGTVAVSSVGTQSNRESSRMFAQGYEEMLRRLHPQKILFYGKVPEGCGGNIVPIPAFTEKWRI